jgi:hypothetical protein
MNSARLRASAARLVKYRRRKLEPSPFLGSQIRQYRRDGTEGHPEQRAAGLHIAGFSADPRRK